MISGCCYSSSTLLPSCGGHLILGKSLLQGLCRGERPFTFGLFTGGCGL